MNMLALRAPIPVPRVYKRRSVSHVCKSYYTVDKNNTETLDEVKSDKLFHVLTFHHPDKEDGLYSIRQSNEDYILAFTNFDDAFRYKILLEAEMDFFPYIQFVSRTEIEHVCNVGGYSCRVVKEGTLVTPPTHTLKITDWERRDSLLNGRWSVREKGE
jgi:hypothetical protein